MYGSRTARDPRRPYLIGVVGAIGSGKSTVARHLERLGAIRIDADRLCHELLDRPEVVAQVRRRLGDGLLAPDGTVDRKAVADRVFEDEDRLRRLSEILHPRVWELIQETIDTNTGITPGTRIVLEVALLIESGLAALCDDILFVQADARQRQRRVVEDRGWSLHELRRREQYQIGEADKRSNADIVIDNGNTLEHTHKQISDYWRGLGR